ncbi:hypothetical protein GCM10017783_03940 [Deinococcus piscis]|uniref:HTH cro/C1-type domain-containing protein n=1 Tax=Deinococcus piscis TaxID=394230 RepID=A0ABQ3JZH4_9DEIO|nr:helix-turn-helix domain-containing protein [Deinococcus piscis]GHF95247.1 hypothetical protein GCM10017783_03940 [Deinococcus piscis]
MDRYGEALRRRREHAGYRSQSDLARAVRALHTAGDLPAGLKPFSQQWLSRLEEDTEGHILLSARAQQLRALAYMLGWSGTEFEAAVGVPVGTVPGQGEAEPGGAAAQGWKVSGEQRPVPTALLEAAEVFGVRPEFAELREERWLHFLTSLHHRRTPQTAGEWLALFLDLRERFDPPPPGAEAPWTP